MVRAFGAKLEGDPGIREWLDEQILTAIPPLVEEHRAKIGRFIEDQINGWQEKKLVGELERHIGSDLRTSASTARSSAASPGSPSP